MGRPRILIVDDDLGTCQTLNSASESAGYRVEAAVSGTEALSRLRDSDFDAAVIELRLPDMSGMNVARILRNQHDACPFILVSAFLTTTETVEAMRLGAFDVRDKPLSIEDLYAVLRAAIDTARDSNSVAIRVSPAAKYRLPKTMAHSCAQRWADAVLRACEAGSDPKTLNEWARIAGQSYSSLRELCRILDIRAHDARDFARMLRAVMKSHQHHCSPKVFLDVGDERTLRLLFQRAGLESFQHGVSPNDFVRRQQFVRFEHHGLQLLLSAITRRAVVSASR